MNILTDDPTEIPLPPGNPDIYAASAGTRFGSPGFLDPREGARRSAETKRRRKEVRKKFQDLIDEGFPVSSIDDLQTKIQEFMSKGDMQSALALRLLGFGLAGSLDDLSEVIANNEGRLAEKRELDLTVAYVNLTDEEADQRILQLLATAERNRAKALAGPVETPGGSADGSAGEQS